MIKNDNFTKWFDDLLLEANILDNRYPVKGFAVYKGWGSRIIKKIINILENELESTNHEPMMFPIVIPEDSFAKESDHIKGFNSEVFWITHAGKRLMSKKLLLRPTSETAIYPLFAYWIRSHADLPFKMHQTVSVYRYETRATRPLLRMREFIWNEAHTAHENWAEAEKQVEESVRIYTRVFECLALNYLVLKRPDFDKFAGAVFSIAFDAWNPDGRVNQIGTIHNLGDNFAKAFDITYEDTEGNHRNVIQTCYGLGLSRSLAALIAQHGDDHGLVIPPEIAPVQVVVVPITYKQINEEVKIYSREVYMVIKKMGLRVIIDDDEKTKSVDKFYKWERFGVPVRVEVGPKDLAKRCVTLSERIGLKRKIVRLDEVAYTIQELLTNITEHLRKKSQKNMQLMIIEANDLDSVKKIIMSRKIAKMSWCGRNECAEIIKAETRGGEIRGHRFDRKEKPQNRCAVCDQKAVKVVYIAKSY